MNQLKIYLLSYWTCDDGNYPKPIGFTYSEEEAKEWINGGGFRTYDEIEEILK